MKAYRVKNWGELYEKSHKSTEGSFRWVAITTRWDSKGFKRLAKHPEKVAVFCAWILIIQQAAKTPVRGILIDSDGRPLDAEELALGTEFPPEIFERAFAVLSDKDLRINWLEEFEVDSVATSRDKSRYKQTDSTNKQTSRPQSELPGFTRFWGSWPKHSRKTNRAGCLKRWQSASLEPLTEEILRGLNRWKASAQWEEQDGRFIPAPLVWLNQERWTAADALDPASKGPGDNGFVRAPITQEVAERIGMPWPPPSESEVDR